jgi:hypothetical protein
MIFASESKQPIANSFLQSASTTIPAAAGADSGTGVRSATRAALALAVVMLPAAAFSSPRVLEEVARVTVPDATFASAHRVVPTRVAVQGDDLIITGAKEEVDAEGSFDLVQAACLFRRQANGSWSFVTQLGPERRDNVEETDASWMAAAIDGDVLAVQPRELRVYERTPTGWVSAPTDGLNFFDSTDLEISNGTIVVGHDGCNWNGEIVRKNSSGVWTLSATAVGGFTLDCDDDNFGGDVDISGDTLIVANEELDATFFSSPEARIYERAGNTWPEVARLGNFGTATSDLVRPVAIDGSTAYVGGTAVQGLRVYDRNAVGEWPHTTTISPADAFMISEDVMDRLVRPSVEAEGYVVVVYPNDPYRQGSVAVFQRQTSGKFEQIARLVRSDAIPGSPRITDVEIDVGPARTTIVLGSAGTAYVYELEDTTQPPLVQDDFEDGDDAGWRIASSTWRTIRARGSFVYEQTRTSGDARTVLQNLDQQDVAIQAVVRALSFNGSGRFVALMARYVDDANHYYAALKNTNRLELRKRVNGVDSLIVAKAFTVVANRDYRLRLEAIAGSLRVYVDGKLQLARRDADLTRGGAGLRANFARAQFDNVVVTPNPAITLAADNFQDGNLAGWTLMPPANWSNVVSGGTRVLRQSATGGAVRAIAGSPDAPVGEELPSQIVEARARPLSFTATGEAWFGLIARYKDNSNYLHVVVTRTGTVSVRKLVNGAVQVLASTSNVSINTGVWYRLRLEAVGDRVRLYFNNRLLLQGVDLTPVVQGDLRAQFGVMTSRASAEFDDIQVVQP